MQVVLGKKAVNERSHISSSSVVSVNTTSAPSAENSTSAAFL